jgi:uncharacterized protein (DUF4415 family)
MRFEWDAEKNRINQQTHDGIAFESAALVFDDPHAVFRKDRVVSGESSGGTPSEPRRAPCCWLRTCIAWSMIMTKMKPSVSSRPKLISVSARSIFGKSASKEQKAALSRIAKRQAAGDDSEIDYSDIPPLTDAQLAQFRRAPKVLVAARIDKEVYDWLMQYGKGYSSRINGILRTVMERTR